MNLKLTTVYGLLAGLIIAIMMQASLMYYSGNANYEQAEIVGYISIFLGFTLVYFGVKKHKENQYKEGINFKQAFMAGLKIVLFASTLYALLWLLYITINGNEFMENYYERAAEKINEGAGSATDKEAKLEKLAKTKKIMVQPWAQTGMAFMELFPVGLLVSVISAAILRKKD